MEGYEKDEPSETCRALIRDNIQEVEYLAQNEVLNIRIFLIFQLEPDMKLRGSTLEAAATFSRPASPPLSPFRPIRSTI